MNGIFNILDTVEDDDLVQITPVRGSSNPAKLGSATDGKYYAAASLLGNEVQAAITTGQFDKTNSTTLEDVTNLSVDVEVSETYIFEATLFTISDVSTGVKAAIGGTCSEVSIIYEATTYSGTAIAAHTRTTTKGNAVGGVTAVTAARIDITGTIAAGTSSTLTVQFAENAAVAATTSSVLSLSKFTVTKVNVGD